MKGPRPSKCCLSLEKKPLQFLSNLSLGRGTSAIPPSMFCFQMTGFQECVWNDTNAPELGICFCPLPSTIIAPQQSLKVGRSLGWEVMGREPKTVNWRIFRFGPGAATSTIVCPLLGFQWKALSLAHLAAPGWCGCGCA